MVNQVEVQPYFGNEAVRAANASYDVVTEAWSPIAQGDVLDDPTIVAVAERVGRTPAQVTLRWHVQRGDVIFPKSVNPDRMRENFALFDFELSDDDMAAITKLDQGDAGRHGADPKTMDWIPDFEVVRRALGLHAGARDAATERWRSRGIARADRRADEL